MSLSSRTKATRRTLAWRLSTTAAVGLYFWACGGRKVPSDAAVVAAAAEAQPAPPAEARPLEAIDISPSVLDPPPLAPEPSSEYVIGVDDELYISVYGNTDLAVTQTVRPDGRIAFPLAGSVQASGLTPEALQEDIAGRLSEFVRAPRVTVIVTAFNSKRFITIGELNSPGMVPVGSEISLLEGISRAGGLKNEADLRSAMLVREGKILPVSFEKLLRRGDFSQNVMLRPNDVILVPNVSERKIFVLGEVKEPQVVTAKYDVSLIETIALAGGLTRAAQPKNVLIARGGLVEPDLLTVNLREITEGGDLSKNLALLPGDIVYVPRSTIANVVEYFNAVRDILTPIVLGDTLFRERPVVVPP
jgi:polysaccharide export outer membrane protein